LKPLSSVAIHKSHFEIPCVGKIAYATSYNDARVSRLTKTPSTTNTPPLPGPPPSNRRQWFKPIPKDVVDELIEKGDVMWCCGGFVVDDPLIMPYLDKREGDEDSIIGLPMRLTRQLIAEVSTE
jgi:septum formation protein